MAPRHSIGSVLLAAGLAALCPRPAAGAQGEIEELRLLSLEDLQKIDVTSVTRTPEPLSTAPAAIYVITGEQILRAGARSIPEMLRLAPNLQVARITANSWAITARGFNGAAADKLLVLLDGRTLYTPFFNGVFWDRQDVLPEDIDRIEVISGPAGTLWGTNAVNGVINIITRQAGDTQGGFVKAGGGNREQRAAMQYGGKVGRELSYRAYGEGFRYGEGRTASGADARDGQTQNHGGFRMDWTPENETVTLEGELYDGHQTLPSPPDQQISGQHLLGRWTHAMERGGSLVVQTYVDHLAQSVTSAFSEDLMTYDLEVHHGFSATHGQEWVVGGGARVLADDFPTMVSPGQPVFFRPVRSTRVQENLYAQDTLPLTGSLKLIAGLRVESDAYDNVSPLPSLRLAWQATGSDFLWAAVSRAVRAPSRLDRETFALIQPGGLLAIKGDDFRPEKLIAYELGYRGQPSARASLSVSAYYNVYQDLRSAELSPNGQLPLHFGNGMEGDTYGIEAWGSYQLLPWWRLSAGFDWLHKNLRFKPDSSGLGGLALAGDDPPYQAQLRSSMDLTPALTLDLGLRRIGRLPEPYSPAYTGLDAALRWTVTPSLTLTLGGADSLRGRSPEFGTAPQPLQLGQPGTEQGGRIFLEARWKF